MWLGPFGYLTGPDKTMEVSSTSTLKRATFTVYKYSAVFRSYKAIGLKQLQTKRLTKDEVCNVFKWERDSKRFLRKRED